jgi:CRISPR-associated protein Cmr1
VRVTEIEATYRVVTPCFCGGAEQQAEFRLPSFKGVLRFWWRALARSHYQDLALLRRDENRLFGSAAGGQSRVRMWLSAPPDTTVRPARAVLAGTPGARYIGYGMTDNDRSCLLAPFTVTVTLQYRLPRRAEASTEELPQSLLDALTAVGLLGGIGAKSRKGFGSTVLTELRVDKQEVWSSAGTITELAEQIGGLAPDADGPSQYPEYTALSSRSQCLLIDGGRTSPLQLVDEIGQEYKTHLREVGGADDLLRAGSGLPRHGGRSRTEMKPVAFTRRASPLFIHIHECDGRPVAVLSFLPAVFLPEDRNGIQTTSGKTRRAVESELYQPVNDLLTRLREGAWDVREVTW